MLQQAVQGNWLPDDRSTAGSPDSLGLSHPISVSGNVRSYSHASVCRWILGGDWVLPADLSGSYGCRYRPQMGHRPAQAAQTHYMPKACQRSRLGQVSLALRVQSK